MTTALATIPTAGTGTGIYDPRTLDEAKSLATSFAKSGLLSKGVDTPEKAFTIMAAGAELGLAPMVALRSIYIVEGKPTLSGDTMVALIKRSPACAYFRAVERTDKIATVETMRKGEPEPRRLSFTIEDARKAGLAEKDVWKRYTSTMLYHRAASLLGREVYPDILAGVYLDDEAAELHSAPVVVSAEVQPLPAAPQGQSFAARYDRCATLDDLAALDKEAVAAKLTGSARHDAAEARKAAKARIEAAHVEAVDADGVVVERTPGAEG